MNNVIDITEGVWSCPCGCPEMWLMRDGKIRCFECEEDTGQVWIWDKAND